MRIICLSLKRFLAGALGVVLALCSVGLATTACVVAVRVSTKKRLLPIYSVERTDAKISITFDCAWGADYTDKILTCMAENDVKCTFFAVEFWVEKNADLAKRIVEEGHELGTHSKTHAYMTKQSEAEMRAELNSSSAVIERVTGVKPTLFRAPYGDYDNRLIKTATETGLTTIQWDVDSLDWKNLSAEEIFERIVSTVQEGSIILCHNNGLHTAEALPSIFETLHQKGYQFVPVGQLIHSAPYTVDNAGRQYPSAL